jgi:multiple sugar transport system substrate-binding protein
MVAKKWVISICLLSLVLVLGGCGGKTAGNSGSAEQGQAPSVKDHAPVTLTMYAFSTSTNEKEFQTYMKPFVEKKYPYITLEWIPGGKGQSLDDWIAQGKIPDIVVTGYASIPKLQDKELPVDLNGLAKKNKFDLKVFDPVALQSVTNYGTQGELYGLPYVNNYFAMFYNKDIFDKFGAPYPKDNMTWEDTIELAKKVSRNEDGRQYLALQIGNFATFGRGLSLPVVDPKTDKAILNTDGWLSVLQLLKSIYSIPGNEVKGSVAKFFTDGVTAMLPNWGQATVDKISEYVDNGGSLNWDLVSYPSFKQSPGKTMEISTNIYTISKTSKYQDEAFQAITYLASSNEVQSFSASNGMVPVIKIDNPEKIFGSNVPIFKGKNVAGIFKGESREDHIPSRYDNQGVDAIGKYANQYVKGDISDARTALSQAEEEANQKISETKQ